MRRNRSLRFLDEEWALVTVAAAAAGKTVSAYVRGVLLQPVAAVETSLEERLKAAVDAAGRTLNAFAHQSHLQGRVGVDERTEDALDPFLAALDDIEALLLEPDGRKADSIEALIDGRE